MGRSGTIRSRLSNGGGWKRAPKKHQQHRRLRSRPSLNEGGVPPWTHPPRPRGPTHPDPPPLVKRFTIYGNSHRKMPPREDFWYTQIKNSSARFARRMFFYVLAVQLTHGSSSCNSHASPLTRRRYFFGWLRLHFLLVFFCQCFFPCEWWSMPEPARLEKWIANAQWQKSLIEMSLFEEEK